MKNQKYKLNYRAADNKTNSNILKREYSETNIFQPTDESRSNNGIQNSLKRQNSNFSGNDKLLFDPKKYVK